MTIMTNAGAGALCLTLLATAPIAMAQQQQQQPAQQQQGFIEPDPSNIYVGGGINWNSLSRFDDSVGWQIFAGLDFFRQDLITLAGEVGFFDSGEFDRTVTLPDGTTTTEREDIDGFWLNGVITYNLREFIENSYLIGRLGLDFGDDDGFMLGAGAGYAFGPQFDLRLEYVGRDNVDSVQINGLYRF